MRLRNAVLCLPAIFALAGCEPGPQQGTVALRLRSIEPVALSPGWVLRCQTAFQNATGADLRVVSHRGIPFDSMDIVVVDQDGNEMLRRSCSLHSSKIDFEGTWTTLPVGETVQQLDFVLDDIPQAKRDCKVFIVGTLPGSDYRKELVSNTARLRLP